MKPLDLYLQAVVAGYHRALEKHGPITCQFHAHGIWCEEVDELFEIVRLREEMRPWDQCHLELIDVGVCVVRWAVACGIDAERFVEHVENNVLNNTEPVHQTLHAGYSHLRCHEAALLGNTQKVGRLNYLDAMLVACALTSVHVVQPKIADILEVCAPEARV